MSRHRILVHYNCHWEASGYVGGHDILIYMSMEQVTRSHVVDLIKEALCSTRNNDFTMFFFTSHRGNNNTRIVLHSDTDLFRLIFEQKENAELYVFEKENHEYVPQCNVNVGLENTVPTEGEADTQSDDEADHQSEDEDEDEEEAERLDLFKSLASEFCAWIRIPVHREKLATHRAYSSLFEPSPVDVDVNNDVQSRSRNWVIPVPEVGPLGWVEPPEPILGKLVAGSTFRSKSKLKIAIGMYHMEKHLECVTDRSSRDRLVYICKQGRANCSFRMCAVGGDNSLWRITKLNLEHTCQANLDRISARQVPIKVAATYFARKLVDHGVTIKPREMMSELRRLFGIGIEYNFALRTRNLALEMTYGKYETSYNKLRSYLYLLKQRNAGTFYEISTTREGVFCHMFLALGQSIAAFEENMRPVIVLDGTHLKGKNKGILFAAVTKDANEQIFPLAIGLGPLENDESWTWFLANLSRCYPSSDDLLIVSDQHKSIVNAVEKIYPHAFHATCVFHLRKNLARYGINLTSLLNNAAYCYRVETFRTLFSDIQVLSPDGAYKRLCDIGVERWARSMCPVRRYGFMTSNAAECLNSRLVWARRLPVCSLVEVFRSIVEKWFDERRAKASSRQHELSEEALSKLTSAMEIGQHLIVRETTTHLYKVEDDHLTYHVDLQNWTCECREFDQDLIPCCHAVAAIRRAGLHLYDYVGRYYKQQNLLDTYAQVIEPLPHPDEWNVPSSITTTFIQPPEIPRQAGRPKMSRARAAVEGAAAARRQQVCAMCKGIGHNKRSCTSSFVPVDEVDLNFTQDETQSEPSSSRKVRRKKKCSVCKSEDHTKPKCPMRVD